MSDQQDALDEQFGKMLTRFYGEVKADEGFKTSLLAELKRKTAENRTAGPENQTDDDANWSRLLTRAYVPCEPRAHFKDMLLSELKNKQAISQSESPEEEDDIKTILSSTYEPVTPRREFQTRLLDNLKERQRVTAVMRKKSRNRTIFMSAISSMAAAAAVIFVVWVQPFTPATNQQSLSAPTVLASSTPHQASSEPTYHNNVLASAENVIPMAAAGLALASTGSYRVADVFNKTDLPRTMRGIGMEINFGDGWKPMDETLLASVTPGVALRPRADAQTPGLGFGDGSTIHMRPDSIIEATNKGFAVRRGTMTVNVPNNSDSRFYLHFPERDIALEPGTMLAVSVEPEELYAKGGAPAPVVKVLDGGMAIARGKGGSGVLLANQVYSLDSYVTPDLPGRPLCATECAELERALLVQPAVPAVGYSPTQMVSGGDGVLTVRSMPKGYSKNGNQWIANSYEMDTPTVRIQYLSDDYFGFANERRDLASALALGSEVVIDGGDGQFYEIFR